MVIISLLILAFFLINGIEFLLSQVPKLEDILIPKHFNHFLKISIVIPARNEENDIKKCVQSLLNINYPNLEVIVINDRSTDSTLEHLVALAEINATLKIINNTHLPEDWMGKQYAMQLGANQATGEWLLFTDADILYRIDTLKKAIYYALNNNLDHLTLQPKFNCVSSLFGIIMTFFVTSFALQYKPWRANNLSSKKSMGIGAFNLIKKSVYESIGGHSRIRMNSDDDLKLGQIIKENGFTQGLVSAINDISVSWYPTVKSMITGLEKNSFSICNYNILLALVFSLMTAVLYFFPIIMLFSTNKVIVLINLFTIVFTITLQIQTSKKLSYNPLYGFFYPLGALFSIYVLLRSMTKIVTTGSVRWRGTIYPLKLIKSCYVKTKF